MKKCKKCERNKEEKDFYTYHNKCKECEKDIETEKHRTTDGLIRKTYLTQKASEKRRGRTGPEYSYEEFKVWFKEQGNFLELYTKWLESGFKKDLRPSVDRKKDSVGYTFDNIELMTWNENSKKAYKDRIDGNSNSNNIAIIQITKEGIEIKEFHSAAKAGRKLKTNSSHIVACCKNKRKTAAGYKWRYSDDS